MIDCLSGKAAFSKLQAVGIRVRRGPLRVVYAERAGVPAVAFAVPRHLGTAVTRNRIRRRLRAILFGIDRETPELLKGGDYLLSVSSPLEHLSHDKLCELVLGLLHELDA